MIRSFSAALLFVALAMVVRDVFLDSLEGRVVWLTFYPAVMAAALYGGFWTGIIAAVFSCFAAVYMWDIFSHQIFIKDSGDWLGLAIFFVNGTLISAMAESSRRARLRADKAYQNTKKAEQSLRETRDYLGNLLDYANAPIIVWDSEFKITRFNHAFEELTGRSAAEVVGKEMEWLFPEDHRQASLDYIRTSTGARWKTVEIDILAGDGTVHTLLWNSAMLYADDGVTVVATIAQGHDITGRIQAEGALREVHQQMLLQEKMASIGQLAAGVAHEINNPMGFITSNLGSLEKYVSRISDYLEAAEHVIADSEASTKTEMAALRARLKVDYILKDTRQLLEESLDGATRVKNIVDDLKNISRVDKSEPVYTDINKCLQSSLNIACNEIKYVADIILEAGDIPTIPCHPQQISQVFINLLSNAGQAIEGHGTITVRTWSEDNFVCVSVADTGKGMSEQIRTKIFDPFFTTKEIGKGTGLGLSISYDIIQKHGGKITVDSEVGKGTVFVVRLPLGQLQSGDVSK